MVVYVRWKIQAERDDCYICHGLWRTPDLLERDAREGYKSGVLYPSFIENFDTGVLLPVWEGVRWQDQFRYLYIGTLQTYPYSTNPKFHTGGGALVYWLPAILHSG